MALTVALLTREFMFNGVSIPDPGSDFTIDQVRASLALMYPEIATAAVEGPTPVDGKLRYTFCRSVGIKG